MCVCVCEGSTDRPGRDPNPASHQAPPPVGGTTARGGVAHCPADRHRGSRTQAAQLWRENGRLQEQLRGSEQLNASLRSELEIQRSVQAQRPPEPGGHPDRPGSPPQAHSDGREAEARAAAEQDGGQQAGAMTTGPLLLYRSLKGFPTPSAIDSTV